MEGESLKQELLYRDLEQCERRTGRSESGIHEHIRDHFVHSEENIPQIIIWGTLKRLLIQSDPKRNKATILQDLKEKQINTEHRKMFLICLFCNKNAHHTFQESTVQKTWQE
ncbi:hypothetical protein ElyMa_002158200 [Elysia marginata]|uniref:Uncharacterized protein n=1 Tax=Elysia marginata TaxID=1093978 RepID=A0AAV4FLS4_9GAST|nr:hypothetical protein ElyMa_002158200 [Elysia marginata]